MMRPPVVFLHVREAQLHEFQAGQRAGLVRQQRVIRIDVLNRPVKHSALGAVDQNVDRVEMSDSFIDDMPDLSFVRNVADDGQHLPSGF